MTCPFESHVKNVLTGCKCQHFPGMIVPPSVCNTCNLLSMAKAGNQHGFGIEVQRIQNILNPPKKDPVPQTVTTPQPAQQTGDWWRKSFLLGPTGEEKQFFTGDRVRITDENGRGMGIGILTGLTSTNRSGKPTIQVVTTDPTLTITVTVDWLTTRTFCIMTPAKESDLLSYLRLTGNHNNRSTFTDKNLAMWIGDSYDDISTWEIFEIDGISPKGYDLLSKKDGSYKDIQRCIPLQ